jgi:glyoxylase-like metal-dependent hydrolase (beta-lactamase superfamily II)
MPEEFSERNCLSYHRARSTLHIHEIGDGWTNILQDIDCLHLPGHSPDALTVFLGEEAVILGDTVLPEITPVPSRESFFDHVRPILDTDDKKGPAPYGLRAYIRSLKRLIFLAQGLPDSLALPAHRLVTNGLWNEFHLVERIEELLQHHLERCGDILQILNDGPDTARGIAKKHFDERLLEGFGILMAEHEILSHCELLEASGDVDSMEGTFAATGSKNFEALISALKPWGDEN